MLGTDSELRLHSLDDSTQETPKLLGIELPSRSLFERYKPKPEWFLRQHGLNCIHGIEHITRVMIWQEILSRLIVASGTAKFVDQEAIRWAAATHDTQRADDYFDYGHGDRSSEWVLKNFHGVLSSECLEKAAFINKWHVPSDFHAPEMTAELAIFKDADGLDRVRCRDLDPAMLRHGYLSQLLITPAENLYWLSTEKQWQRNQDLFDCVIDSGIELGLIVDA